MAAFTDDQISAVFIGIWGLLKIFGPGYHLKPKNFGLGPEARVLLHLARMLPKVQLKRVGIEKTGDVFVLKIEIANVGYLPTNISDVAKSLKVHESPVVRMKVGRDQKILQGKAETFCEHLEGRSSSLPWISPFWGSSVEKSNENQFAWTIKGPGRVEFEVSYHGAGVFRTSVSLE